VRSRPVARVLQRFLARCSANHRFDQRVLNFKGVGQKLRNVRGYHSGQQHFAERLLAATNISITEPPNKVTGTNAKCA
jgi:hypothetical protein